MSQEKSPLLQPVDQAALTLAARLLRDSTLGALAVLEVASGYPLVSRVTVAADCEAYPVLLLSRLSHHTQALLVDSRCSLLVGEPGNGDPLAHPRITVFGQAQPLARAAADHADVRQRFLAMHPKAALYADFGDFDFWRLAVQRASLNAGFGRAYQLDQDQITQVLRQRAAIS